MIIFIISMLITIISFVFFGYMLCKKNQFDNNDIISVYVKKLYGEPYIWKVIYLKSYISSISTSSSEEKS